QDKPVACYIGNGFNRLRRWYIHERRKIGNAGRIRRQYLLQSGLFLARKLGAHKLRLLTVSCVIAGIALHSFILARLGDSDELLRVFAADRPAISMNDDEVESTATKDRGIGFAHLVIADIESCLIGIEA